MFTFNVMSVMSRRYYHLTHEERARPMALFCSRTWLRAGAAAAVLTFGGIATTVDVAVLPVAAAHDAVLQSTPADGETVAEFPRTLTLEFSGIPKDNFNTIAVSDAADGTVLFSAEPVRNQQFMTVQVPEDIHPGPGDYIIGFQITSSDGHATRGKTTFTVAAEAPTTTVSPTVEEDVSAADKPSASGMSLGVIVGIMALIAVCGGAVATLKKRK